MGGSVIGGVSVNLARPWKRGFFRRSRMFVIWAVRITFEFMLM